MEECIPIHQGMAEGRIQSKSSTYPNRAQCMHQREASVCLPMRESSTLI